MRKPIDQIKPEDAIPLFIRLKQFIFGKKRPDGFTRLLFSFSLFSWTLLTIWNAVSYFVLLSAAVIEENKGFSVTQIIRKNGQNLGFNGDEFLTVISNFYFYNLFIWVFIFIGLVLMYRKTRKYTFFILGGLAIHFIYMLYALGFQYFIEDVSFFDKMLYAILIGVTLIHSFLMYKEKESQEVEVDEEKEGSDESKIS